MAPAEDKQYDVVIVGAGITGLMAAFECQKSGLSVCVLEARKRVGGRAETMTLKFDEADSFFDHGARFLGKHTHQLHLWQFVTNDLGFEPTPQYQGPEKPDEDDSRYWAGYGANILRVGGQTQAYIGQIMPTDELGLVYLKYLKTLIDNFPIHRPSLMTGAKALDKLSVKRWIDTLILPGYERPNSTFKAMLRTLCRVGFSDEPERISMLWFLFYIASSGGLERFQSLRWPVQGSQGYRLPKGAQSIAEKICEVLKKDTVRLGCKVTRIVDDGADRVRIFYNKSEVVARKTLVALSPTLYSDSKRFKFEPDLCVERRAAAKAMSTPNMVLAYVTFNEPFWRTDKASYPKGMVDGKNEDGISRYGLSGDVLLTDGPVVWMMDATSNAGQPALFAFIVGKSAEKFAKEKTAAARKAARKKAVLSTIKSIFGPAAMKAKPAYHEKDWSIDKLTGGAPTAHFGQTGTFFKHGNQILLMENPEPHGNVYFASSETSMISNGYMAGAAWSGKKVAADIRAAIPTAPVRTRMSRASIDKPTPELARELAMRWCIRTILRAVKEQDPTMEFPALAADVEFYGPGGSTFGYGPWKFQETFDFYRLLNEKVTLTNVNIESCAVDVAKDTGFAVFTVDGCVNGNGNPFRDIKATMAFEFTPIDQGQVKVKKDWLFLNVEAIDAMASAPPGPFSENFPAGDDPDDDPLNELEATAAAIAMLRWADAGDEPFVVNCSKEFGPDSPYSGKDGLQVIARRHPNFATTTEVKSSQLDRAAMTYHSWQMFEGKRLLVTVVFKDSHVPKVSEVYFEQERIPAG